MQAKHHLLRDDDLVRTTRTNHSLHYTVSDNSMLTMVKAASPLTLDA